MISRVIELNSPSLSDFIYIHTEGNGWVSVGDIQGKRRLPSQDDGPGGTVDGDL